MEVSDVPNEIESDYSESFVDFYKSQPSWLIRYGLAVVVILLVVVFILGSLIRYPDLIKARAYVSSENPPMYIESKLNGVVDSVAKENYEWVNHSEVVAIVQSTVDYKDFLVLKENLVRDLDYLESQNLNIGDLQEYYSQYRSEVNKNEIRNTLDEATTMESRLRNAYHNKVRLIRSLKEKKNLMNSEVLLEEKQFERYSILHDKGVISTNDLEEFQKSLYSKKQRLKDIEVTISTSDLEVIEIQKSLDENYNRDFESNLILNEAVRSSRKLLIEKMKAWEENYVLKAPSSGRIFYHKKSIEKGDNIKLGEEVFTILPKNHGEIYCEMTIPFFNSGKVQSGQEVNLFLDNYPFQEYGTVKGTVISVSSIPNEDGYFVRARLPVELETSYGLKIGYKPRLVGRCEIITEDLTLIQRIFNKLKGLIDNV